VYPAPGANRLGFLVRTAVDFIEGIIKQSFTFGAKGRACSMKMPAVHPNHYRNGYFLSFDSLLIHDSSQNNDWFNLSGLFLFFVPARISRQAAWCVLRF